MTIVIVFPTKNIYISSCSAFQVLRVLSVTPLGFWELCTKPSIHRRSHGTQGAMVCPKFLAYSVILCFEKRCSKHNTVAHLKSNILLTHKILRSLYATASIHFNMVQSKTGEVARFSLTVFCRCQLKASFSIFYLRWILLLWEQNKCPSCRQ